MNIVVTGGSGQLGTVVLRQLARDRTVASIVNLDTRHPIAASGKITTVLGDVRDPAVGRHFGGADAVVHLAFLVTQAAPREVMEAVNVEGSKNVFRAAAAAGAKQIVYASSVAAYGVVPGHPNPIGEDATRHRQESFNYPRNKFDVEAFLDDFEREHPDVAIARFRPAILVGSRMEHALGRMLLAGFVPDPDVAPLPVVWDEDVAQAMSLALKKKARGAFNVVADAPLTARALASAAGLRRVPVNRTVLRALARLGPLVGAPAADDAWADLDLPELVYSSDKAKRELGWDPKYPTTVDVARHMGEVAPRRTDPRIAGFMALTAALVKRAPPRAGETRDRATLHFELTGRGGGDWTLHLADGKLRVERGVPRPPTGVVSLSASTFLELLAGKTSPATAQLVGRIKVEGEPTGNMIVAGIVGMFREQVDARKWPAVQLARWMAA